MANGNNKQASLAPGQGAKPTPSVRPAERETEALRERLKKQQQEARGAQDLLAGFEGGVFSSLNTQQLVERAKGLGLDVGEIEGQTNEVFDKFSDIFKRGGGANVRKALRKDVDQKIREQLESRVKNLSQSQKETGLALRDSLLSGLKAGEEDLRNQLGSQQEELQGLLESQLQLGQEEIEEQIGEEGSALGQAAASRGLGRSTFASRAQEQVLLAEQRAKTQLASKVEERSQSFEEFKTQTLDRISNRRRELEKVARPLTQINQAEDISFQLEVDEINTQIKEQVAQIEQEAQGFGIGDVLGGIVGTAASIFTGGLL